jgi:hypothetical protein
LAAIETSTAQAITLSGVIRPFRVRAQLPRNNIFFSNTLRIARARGVSVSLGPFSIAPPQIPIVVSPLYLA